MFPRHERIETLLHVRLAPCQQFLRIGVIPFVLARPLGPSQPQRAATVVQARVELFELLRPAFDVELATRNVGGPLAEGALEVLQLDELRGALLFSLLGEPAREAEQLLPAGVVLRVLPGSFPPE